MPSKTDEIIAAFEELLKRRGTQKPTDRLGLERPVVSRDFDNQPMAGWEKAASLIGAAVSPASTIASMVLAPPQEESLFDRAITGLDGKTYYPEISESVVPRMKKAQRKSITPNPIVTALHRAAQKGPFNDPANDLIHQKINDRDFLVHATRPKDAKLIQKTGGILPGSRSDTLPDTVLKDPIILKGIKDGTLSIRRSPIDTKIRIERTLDGHEYRIDTRQPTGLPGVDESESPGVSLSRQMIVPELSKEKSYRFLLNPKARSTFSTSEPGYGKKYANGGNPYGSDLYESEQRTFGTPYPVLRGNRATVAAEPSSPTEEFVRSEKIGTYRATMGNEKFRHIRERIGEVFGGTDYKKYKELDAVATKLGNRLSALQAQALKKLSEQEILELQLEWAEVLNEFKAIELQKAEIKLPYYLKNLF